MTRRNRLAFSEEEITFLHEGIERFKNRKQIWKCILESYAFHPRRTTVDLKDKWRNLLKRKTGKVPGNGEPNTSINPVQHVKWSDDEVRALKEGYQEFYDEKRLWSKILNKHRGRFHPSRSSVKLKDKWRTLRGQESRLADNKVENPLNMMPLRNQPENRSMDMTVQAI